VQSSDAEKPTGLKCLFIVQGEGRGHMTQALALRGMLEKAGHHIPAVLVGHSDRRKLPAFFLDQIGAPVEQFESPNFVTDPKNKGVHLWPSVMHNLRRSRVFLRSMRMINVAIERHKPDVVINFYDLLAGVFFFLRRPAVPMIAVGHQYMFHHPAYPFPEGRQIDRWGMRLYTAATACTAVKRLAISIYRAEDIPAHRIAVVPPLLRGEVLSRSQNVDEPFLLVYLLNSGYAEEIIRWHEKNPTVQIDCFWDKPDAEEVVYHDDSLRFHRLSGDKFINLMARCRGLVTTAGFESVCEAMYLGKPVLMVPVEGHYEQQCNAMDFSAVGAGIMRDHFDIDAFLEFITRYSAPTASVRRWVNEAERMYLQEIESVVRPR
jgi:uncharacterized protein (TIGR00661 family)